MDGPDPDMPRGTGSSVIRIVGLIVGTIILVSLAAGFVMDPGSVTATATATTTGPGPGVDSIGSVEPVNPVIGYQEISATHRLVLTPASRGTIDVYLEYQIPEPVHHMRIRLPDDASAVDPNGFVAVDQHTYEWLAPNRNPSLRFTIPANVTDEAAGPIAGRGNLLFVDRGEWALVNRPSIQTDWSWRGAGVVSLQRELATSDPGVAGTHIAFLGHHSTDIRTAHGQRFELVIPDAATMAESPDAIHDALAYASDSLRVGSRDRRVFVVAAPTDDVRWAVRGLQTGPADMWVRDRDRLADPENVWIHEYVHTRQDFMPTDSVRWFVEGSAVYYAVLLTYERGDISFEAFRNRLHLGTVEPHRDDILADPETWTRTPDYFKGALVAGELDRQIRVATDGERSLEDVFRAMNVHEGTVDQQAFLTIVESVGGESVREDARRYTETDAVPTMWDASEHRAVFDRTPARFDLRLREEPPPFEITGPYRSLSLEHRETIVLVPEETLLAHATVENRGAVPGTFEGQLWVDGQKEASKTGLLAAGERQAFSFERTFDETGTYRIVAADRAFRVVVVPPATASVTSLDIEPSQPQVGEPVAVTATLDNPTLVPARTNVSLEVDGAEREHRVVHMDAEATRSITFETTFDRAGSYRITVGDASTTIDAIDPDAETVAPLPGFTPGAGLVAITLAVAVLLLRGPGRTVTRGRQR